MLKNFILYLKIKRRLKERKKIHENKLKVIKSLLSYTYGGILSIDTDYNISIKKDEKSNSYIFISNKMLDEKGEFILKFKEVDNFYTSDLDITSCKGFPKKIKSLSMENTKIENIDLEYVDSYINFSGSNIKSIKINKCGNLSLYGNLSNVNTFSNIPGKAYFLNCSPFNKILSDDFNFKDSGRNSLDIEALFIITKREITKRIESDICNPIDFYLKLYQMIINNKKILGVYEEYKKYKEIINWPKDFFKGKYIESAHTISKFNL